MEDRLRFVSEEQRPYSSPHPPTWQHRLLVNSAKRKLTLLLSSSPGALSIYRDLGLTVLKEDSVLIACRMKSLLENGRDWRLLHLQIILRIDAPGPNFCFAARFKSWSRSLGKALGNPLQIQANTRFRIFSTSSGSAEETKTQAERRMFFSARTIVSTRPLFFSLLIPEARQFAIPIISASYQVRHGSMKVKRIQKKQPTEKNRIWKSIRGTKLQPKFKKKKVKIRGDADPNKYIDVKEVEFDPWDITGRTTLKVLLKLSSR